VTAFFGSTVRRRIHRRIQGDGIDRERSQIFLCGRTDFASGFAVFHARSLAVAIERASGGLLQRFGSAVAKLAPLANRALALGGCDERAVDRLAVCRERAERLLTRVAEREQEIEPHLSTGGYLDDATEREDRIEHVPGRLR
jgi:hypothetical protein